MLFVFLQTFEVSEIKRKKKGNCLKRHNRHTHLPCCECAVPSNGFMLRWSRYMVELHTKSLAEVNTPQPTTHLSMWRQKLCLHQILECGICIILS